MGDIRERVQGQRSCVLQLVRGRAGSLTLVILGLSRLAEVARGRGGSVEEHLRMERCVTFVYAVDYYFNCVKVCYICLCCCSLIM